MSDRYLTRLIIGTNFEKAEGYGSTWPLVRRRSRVLGTLSALVGRYVQ